MAKESNFKKVQKSIEKKEGYSPKAAAATAAKIGRESIGQAAMTKRSVAGKEAKSKHMHTEPGCKKSHSGDGTSHRGGKSHH